VGFLSGSFNLNSGHLTGHISWGRAIFSGGNLKELGVGSLGKFEFKRGPYFPFILLLYQEVFGLSLLTLDLENYPIESKPGKFHLKGAGQTPFLTPKSNILFLPGKKGP